MGKKKTEQRTKKDLKNALEHLDYENWMLRSLANILAVDNQSIGVIHNALLESFLIHARILIEFLYREEPYKNTVIASQYFTPKDHWKSICPKKTELLKNTRQDAHEQLAHLTYTRLKKKTRWHYMKIVEDIEAAMNIFRKNLSQAFTED
jgi:hypothetical protein